MFSLIRRRTVRFPVFHQNFTLMRLQKPRKKHSKFVNYNFEKKMKPGMRKEENTVVGYFPNRTSGGARYSGATTSITSGPCYLPLSTGLKGYVLSPPMIIQDVVQLIHVSGFIFIHFRVEEPKERWKRIPSCLSLFRSLWTLSPRHN